jgi:hypothetical protein
MKKLILALALLLTIGTGQAMAQEPWEENYTSAEIHGGYSSLWGGLYTIVFDVDYAFDRYFAIRFGEEFDFDDFSNTDIRPAFFHDFDFGRFTVEALAHLSVNRDVLGIGLGAGLGLDTKYAWANVGYFHRTFYYEDDTTIKDPFNIYYEVGVHCLPTIESWDLDFSVTNSRLCALDYHYQPTFILTGRCWLMDDLGIELGVEYKPAGIFKQSSNFYKVMGVVGISYKW